MPILETKEKPKYIKENCEHYNPKDPNGSCLLYLGDCFHENGDTAADTRCLKIHPRSENELWEWMTPILCSDCNEVICNDCSQYHDHKDSEAKIFDDDYVQAI
jgi:hypothetical protein